MRIATLLFVSFIFTLHAAAAEPKTVDAEALFRQLESKLAEAKTVQCDFHVVAKACPGGSAAGTLAIAEGNKSRVEIHGETRDDRNRVVTTCDGAKMVTIGTGEAAVPTEAPKWLNDYLKTAFARGGMMMNHLVPLPEKTFKADDLYAVSNFKSLGPSSIDSHDANLIQYTLVTNGFDDSTDKTRFTVKLWLDAKTNLPLKRVAAREGEDADFTITETYKNFVLDGKIEPQQFGILTNGRRGRR